MKLGKVVIVKRTEHHPLEAIDPRNLMLEPSDVSLHCTGAQAREPKPGAGAAMSENLYYPFRVTI